MDIDVDRYVYIVVMSSEVSRTWFFGWFCGAAMSQRAVETARQNAECTGHVVGSLIHWERVGDASPPNINANWLGSFLSGFVSKVL